MSRGSSARRWTRTREDRAQAVQLDNSTIPTAGIKYDGIGRLHGNDDGRSELDELVKQYQGAHPGSSYTQGLEEVLQVPMGMAGSPPR